MNNLAQNNQDYKDGQEEGKTIVIISSTGDSVKFDPNIEKLCDLVQKMPDKSAPLTIDISTELIILIKSYAEKHNYDKKSMTYQFPTISTSIEQNIDSTSYEQLKHLIVQGSHSQTAKKLATLINAALILGFRKLYTILNVILIIPLHIDESEEGVRKFMENHHLTDEDDFNSQKINKAIADNNEMFELVNQRMSKNIEELDRIQGIVD